MAIARNARPGRCHCSRAQLSIATVPMNGCTCAARGSIVKLRLQRLSEMTEPVREYALEDGRLLHQAAAQPEDSRDALAMAVLARVGRREAGRSEGRRVGKEGGRTC